MKTYEIKYEPVTVNGVEKPKYNVYYSDGVKEFHSVDGINGVIKEGYKDIKAPNWLGLEQDLRYSSVFGRRKEVDPVDFNIFTTTLVNGKLGHASENALIFGFGILGLDWSKEEKDLINGLLEKHNFVFRLENSGARMFTRSVLGDVLSDDLKSDNKDKIIHYANKKRKTINWQLIERIAIYLSISALIAIQCLNGLK
jgi:hypothetical protein